VTGVAGCEAVIETFGVCGEAVCGTGSELEGFESEKGGFTLGFGGAAEEDAEADEETRGSAAGTGEVAAAGTGEAAAAGTGEAAATGTGEAAFSTGVFAEFSTGGLAAPGSCNPPTAVGGAPPCTSCGGKPPGGGK